MTKLLFNFFKIIIILYILLCGILYFYQEKIIFLPTKLNPNFQFKFKQSFEERNFITPDGKKLNGLLFKSENLKGLIFYLHGNAGNLNSWGFTAETYTRLHYDVFILDYRGYGKSEGKIKSQQQLFDDATLAYQKMKQEYNENKIIITGDSIGSGIASYLAATNHPKKLILQAPYYNLTTMMQQKMPFIPSFILKYKLENNEYLKTCRCPVYLFHGKEDTIIPFQSSQKLKEECMGVSQLILINYLGHNGMNENSMYQSEIEKILQ
ncbi:alpha/beta hydrolase [Flavobacterium sp. J27]|uniref:alpha/beta hydrolase n=1 Tax=Flavobacterium sp. J27 TaxID=2060419 RepID=UPI001031FE28|nr:alpha/beta fold hydrolase [Flavobacterium sp. J27]